MRTDVEILAAMANQDRMISAMQEARVAEALAVKRSDRGRPTRPVWQAIIHALHLDRPLVIALMDGTRTASSTNRDTAR